MERLTHTPPAFCAPKSEAACCLCSDAKAARRGEPPMERLRRLEARVLELEQRLPANHAQARPCRTGML